MIKSLFVSFIVCLTANLCAQIPKITPDLQKIIEATPPGNKIDIIIVMSAKYVFPPYTVVIKEQREQIVKERMQTLKNFNTNDQMSLLKYLEKSPVRSKGEGIKSNLVKNYLSIKATSDLITELSKRDDILFMMPYDAVKFSAENLSDSELNIIDSSKDFRTNIERLSDSNPITRRNAIIYLANEKNPQSLQHILKMLGDENALVRRTAVESLSNFSGPKIAKPLIELLKTEKDISVKFVAIKVLGELKLAASVKPLKSLLKDPYPLFRSEAVKSLGKINEPTTHNLIVNMITDEAEGVRIAAMEVSARLKLKSSLPLAIKNLNDPVAPVRRAACEVLGSVGGESEIEKLKNIVASDKDADVRTVAANSLELIKSRLRRR